MHYCYGIDVSAASKLDMTCINVSQYLNPWSILLGHLALVENFPLPNSFIVIIQLSGCHPQISTGGIIQFNESMLAFNMTDTSHFDCC